MSVRFAPSPTGRFHIGNLRTAWISRQWADLLGVPWVLRFEDIDTPRVLPGAQEMQLQDLKSLGCEIVKDRDRVEVQSQFADLHWSFFQKAIREGQVYPCSCSRKEVQDALASSASAPHGAMPIYTGRCRSQTSSPSEFKIPSLAWRFKMPNTDFSADFIVARTFPKLDTQGVPPRADFIPSYHWACAIDDWVGQHRLLVRAWDLAEVADAHRGVMSWLGHTGSTGGPVPAIFHTALVTQNNGDRLEKRTRGVTLPELCQFGWNPDLLIQRFEASWRMEKHSFLAGQVFGENKRTQTLSELGIGSSIV